MSKSWLTMTASDLGRGIGTGEIDPVDLTQTYLDAAKSHTLTPRIYARLTEPRAQAEAEAASKRAKSGRRLGPLDGVPISWKDLFDSAGVATEAGSAYLKDRIPERDAQVLKTATQGGSVCLGKTHMTELAFSGLGLNPITETPPCINDADAVPGGSSSGAATSVAFGLAAGAIGSDTGGSVRIPAAWNDLVGLKTTHGRLPVKGSVPLCARFDTVGPLCRSVEDAGELLALMEGGTAPDLSGAKLDGMRLMVLETVAFDDIRDAPRKGFDDAASKLSAAGATLESRAFARMNDAMALTAPLFAGEAYAQWGEMIEENPDLMYHEIRTRFMGGKGLSAKDYLQALHTLEAIRDEWNSFIAPFDAVIMPTSPILPPNAERLSSDSEYYVVENLLALRNTRIGNLMGSSALTLPTSVKSAGIMLLSTPFAEEKLLRIGAAAEAALA